MVNWVPCEKYAETGWQGVQAEGLWGAGAGTGGLVVELSGSPFFDFPPLPPLPLLCYWWPQTRAVCQSHPSWSQCHSMVAQWCTHGDSTRQGMPFPLSWRASGHTSPAPSATRMCATSFSTMPRITKVLSLHSRDCTVPTLRLSCFLVRFTGAGSQSRRTGCRLSTYIWRCYLLSCFLHSCPASTSQ